MSVPKLRAYLDCWRDEAVHCIGFAWMWDADDRELQLLFSFGVGTLRLVITPRR